MSILLEPGDIFLTRGCGLLSKSIRYFTRSIGEKRTKVNHVGLVVKKGDFKATIVVEALCKVIRHKLWSQYGPPREDYVAVYRATNLIAEQIKDIVAEAEKQVGKKYGFLMIAAHLKDWLLGRMVGWLFGWQFSDVYLLRRLIPGNK